jgi:LmbE family N-acetylglucosaminyl deacetylase
MRQSYLKKYITEQSKFLILSPHIDDACFSLGGLLSELTCTKLIWNIFSCSDFHKYGNIKDVIAKRIDEDQRFCDKINAKNINAAYEDAHARGCTKLKEYLGISTEIVLSNHRDLIENISLQIINTVVDYKIDILCIPMAVGNHMDHIMVRQSAIMAMMSSGATIPIFFYEDLPYAVDLGNLNQAKEEVSSFYLLKEVHTEISRLNKSELIKLYESQISNRDIDLIINYSVSIEKGKACERLWMVQQ